MAGKGPCCALPAAGAAAATAAAPLSPHQHLPPVELGQKKHADDMEAALCHSQGAEMAAWDVW